MRAKTIEAAPSWPIPRAAMSGVGRTAPGMPFSLAVTPQEECFCEVLDVRVDADNPLALVAWAEAGPLTPRHFVANAYDRSS